MTWADEIGSWEDCVDEGEGSSSCSPLSDRSEIRGDSIRSMPTPSRAIFVWRPSGSLLVVGPSFSFGTARAR